MASLNGAKDASLVSCEGCFLSGAS
ncbi:uncharacterized protein G2W53_019226 [Senna tora]|uniref:Uncharacterized protein n=1 Tax=Senna tora TaxID=362788 RepID=A0A834TTS7_9FABA|nr:uncharacterized protein G2W53_019226 [Senna tora]